MEKELKNEIATIDEKVEAITIKDNTDYEYAGSLVIAGKTLIKKIQAFWEEPIAKARDAHKILTQRRAEMEMPVLNKIDILKRKISVYITEQERIRREEQRRLDDERRKAEEAERAKLAKKAERAEASGKIGKAEELRQAAEDIYIPAAIVETVEKTTRTGAGTITAVKDIEIEITDHKAILKHIIAGVLPITIVAISEPKLKQTIKLHQIDKLEGVMIRQVSKAQFRGAR